MVFGYFLMLSASRMAGGKSGGRIVLFRCLSSAFLGLLRRACSLDNFHSQFDWVGDGEAVFSGREFHANGN